MKISELKRMAKENDYEFYESLEYKSISLTRKISVHGFITNQISINSNTENQVFIENVHCDEKDINMIKAAVEFAETPPDEREDEKKYRFRSKWGNEAGFYLYLAKKNNFTNRIRLLPMNDPFSDKYEFTEEEIEEIKKEYNTDLSEFTREEVEK